MSLFSNVLRRLEDSRNIASLGDSSLEKVKIFAELIARSIAHSVPVFASVLSDESRWSCRYNDVRFHLFLSGKHEEYMLVKEVFIDRTYAYEGRGAVHTIVDCGANIGITTLFFHTQFPHARIIAVEPNPVVFERLAQMTKSIDTITAIRAAIGPTDGTASFFAEEASQGSSLIQRSDDAQKIEVPTLTFASLLEQQHIDSVDILKFDIEGAEEHLFATPRTQKAVRWFVGEAHEDLISMPFESFRTSLERGFDLTLAPTRKRQRYIIKGTQR